MNCLYCNKPECEVFIYQISELYPCPEVWLRLCDRDCFYKYMHNFLIDSDCGDEFYAYIKKDESEKDCTERNALFEKLINNQTSPSPALLTTKMPKSIHNLFSDLPYKEPDPTKFNRLDSAEKLKSVKIIIKELEKMLEFFIDEK